MAKSEYNQDVIHFYYLALLDLYSGMPYSHLEEQLAEFELIENYEACEGVNRALKLADFCNISEWSREIIEVEKLIDNDYRID